jgi:hypothetical protein
MMISGYLLRSWKFSGSYNNENPKSWKMEGSNDGNHWILIDSQSNNDWVTQDWSQKYFPTQTKEAFSYFKFTQTGKNYCGSDYLRFNYFELFGTIFDQQRSIFQL